MVVEWGPLLPTSARWHDATSRTITWDLVSRGAAAGHGAVGTEGWCQSAGVGRACRVCVSPSSSWVQPVGAVVGQLVDVVEVLEHLHHVAEQAADMLVSDVRRVYRRAAELDLRV